MTNKNIEPTQLLTPTPKPSPNPSPSQLKELKQQQLEQQKELHDLEARRNALEIALAQTLPQTVAHLESLVSAMLTAFDTAALGRIEAFTLQQEAHISPHVKTETMLTGEITPAGTRLTESQRHKWQVELAELNQRLADLQAGAGSGFLDDGMGADG